MNHGYKQADLAVPQVHVNQDARPGRQLGGRQGPGCSPLQVTSPALHCTAQCTPPVLRWCVESEHHDSGSRLGFLLGNTGVYAGTARGVGLY